MIDRIFSSAAILLCSMCDSWGPKVITKGRFGNCCSDWLEIYTKTASGRALMYHLLFAFLLNSVYGRNILAFQVMGSVIAYILFTYILVPIHVRELKLANQVKNDVKQESINSTTANQQQNKHRKSSSSYNNSNNNGNVKKNQKSTPAPSKQTAPSPTVKTFIRKIGYLHWSLVQLSTLLVIWFYTDIFTISLVISTLIARLIQYKYTNHTETILMACYLLGSTIPGYKNLFLFNFAGGILILNIFYIDKGF